MDNRLASILNAAVESFIDIGEPVSSGWLYDHYDFGIKPAMIRLEMERLADDGFLEQPHHSAGRVPTDSGFEFFAERALAAGEPDGGGPFEKNLRNFLARSAWPGFVEEMSAGLGLLSAASDIQKQIVYKEGLDDLMGSFQKEGPEEIKSVVKDFVALEGRLKNLARNFFETGAPRVFIGRRSPVTKSACLSVVMGNYETGGGKVVILAIGPKRMDYKKTLKTFKNLKIKNGGRKK